MRRPSSRKIPLKFISRACGLVAFVSASFSVTLPSLHQLEQRLVEIHACRRRRPFRWPRAVCRAGFPQSTFCTVGVLIMISSAGVTVPSTVVTMRWQTTACSVPAELPANLLAFVRFEEIQNAR